MSRRLQLISSDDAKVYPRQHKAPCSDCPWRRDSLKGWTGPNTAAQWLRTASDYWHRIICHTRRRTGIKSVVNFWECAGAAVFRANTQAYYHGKNRPLLKLEADTVKVFASGEEFATHHHREGDRHG